MLEGEESEGVSKEEVAPGRVCTEEKIQLWAEAPQGDVCGMRYVKRVYQHITDVSRTRQTVSFLREVISTIN